VLGLLTLAPPGAGETAPAGPGAEQAADKRARVAVHDNFFDPRSVHVKEGGKVIWTWKGANRHNVRFTKVPRGARRRGSPTRTEGRWRRYFGIPGTYRYVCRIYAGMRGSVTVVPAPEPE
jgi:plastocyanin